MPHVTSGNVTVSRVDKYQGLFTMPAEDVTIALLDPDVTALMPGDWVNYDTSSLPSTTVSASTTGSNAFSVVPSSYTAGWRVLSNDGTTVKIVSVGNVASGLKFVGYYGVPSAYSTIARAYINSSYASGASGATDNDAGSFTQLGLPTSTWRANGNYSTWYYRIDGVGYCPESANAEFRIIITLKSTVKFNSGSGTESDPYTLV